MTQILFLLYLYVAGLLFGMCFKKWIPFNFVVVSGFLWGSLIFSLILTFLFIFGVKINTTFLIILMTTVLVVLGIGVIRTHNIHLETHEWKNLLLMLMNFSLLNFLFITFNFTLATLDSFTILRLGRLIAYDGFTQNAIESFSKWGVLIPVLQSVCLSLHFEYLVSLQFSFAFSFILVFFYLTKTVCIRQTNNQTIAVLVAAITTLILLTTPLYIIQMFFIQGTLTTGIFLFLACICAWIAISEKNNAWFVFFVLSLFGVNFSRSETFTYSCLLIFLLLLANQIQYKTRLLVFLPYISALFLWYLYMSLYLKSGSDSLTPERLPIILALLVLLAVVVLLSKNSLLSNHLFPIVNKFLLAPFVPLLIAFTILKPEIMGSSYYSFISNLFVTGYWGFSFWLIIPVAMVGMFKYTRPSIESFLGSTLFCIILIVLCMVFLRSPYVLYWADSSNRLMTLCLPIGLSLIAIDFCKWLANTPIQTPGVENIVDHY